MMRRKNVMGDSRGKVILQNIWNRLAPSICAASRTSSGMFCRPAKNRMILYPRFFQVAAAVTTTRAREPVVSHLGFTWKRIEKK